MVFLNITLDNLLELEWLNEKEESSCSGTPKLIYMDAELMHLTINDLRYRQL